MVARPTGLLRSVESEVPADFGPMVMPLFNLREFFLAINAERESQSLSWAALARQVGVAASTIRRFADADDAEADGVLALVRWLGAAPEDYVAGGEVMGHRLPDDENVFVRVDMELVAKANNQPSGARGRTRTSIQRLVEAAHRSRQPVASLTRLSKT